MRFNSYANLLLFDGQTASQTHEVSAIVPFDALIWQVQWFYDGTNVSAVDVSYATLQTRSGLAGMYTNANTAPIDIGVISMMGGNNLGMQNFIHQTQWRVGAGSPLYMRMVTGVSAGARYFHCLVQLAKAQ